MVSTDLWRALNRMMVEARESELHRVNLDPDAPSERIAVLRRALIVRMPTGQVTRHLEPLGYHHIDLGVLG